MKISSFNIQNDYNSYNYNKSYEIYNYLISNNIDILGLQEVYSKVYKDLSLLLNNKYNYNGLYRFIPLTILRHVNESNPIISKYKVLSSKTYHMPHLPSLTNRILTIIIIDYKGIPISIYNTHISNKYMSVKKRELDYIYKIISKDKNPKILMGDFNLKTNKEIFNNFCTSLNNLSIKRVEFNNKTFKTSRYKREIDHIFISNDFELIDKKIVTKLQISDHYPVQVEVKLRGIYE